MKQIQDKNIKKWKVVLIKTIDDKEPIYYRLVNLYDYSVENIPAYRLLDEIINNKKDIINVKCKNNSVIIVDKDGYENVSEVIIVDEFDKEVINLYDWALSHDKMGYELLARFDSRKNTFSPSNFKVDSMDKIAWTCKNKHTIVCGFQAYLSNSCSCPICEMEKNGDTPSLSYWAHITDNLDILKEYDQADNNKEYSTSISWKSRKKVFFKKDGEEVQACLYNITVKGQKPPYSNNDAVNLSK